MSCYSCSWENYCVAYKAISLLIRQSKEQNISQRMIHQRQLWIQSLQSKGRELSSKVTSYYLPVIINFNLHPSIGTSHASLWPKKIYANLPTKLENRRDIVQVPPFFMPLFRWKKILLVLKNFELSLSLMILSHYDKYVWNDILCLFWLIFCKN